MSYCIRLGCYQKQAKGLSICLDCQSRKHIEPVILNCDNSNCPNLRLENNTLCQSCLDSMESQRQLADSDILASKHNTLKPIKSDGGSTSYYELTLPQHVVDDIKRQIEGCCETIKIETGDVIEMLVGNDFDAGNIIKALRRIFEAKKGKGKVGTTIQYDINKCRYSIDEVEKKL